MKRSNVRKEKLFNKPKLMNHRDDVNSDLIKSFSVEKNLVNCDRAIFCEGVSNQKISEHIYENVPRANQKKHKSLSKLVISLTSKARDLSFKKYAKKFLPKMIENYDACDEKLVSAIDYQREEIDDDIYSYTSCQEENIYENLNFDIDGSADETITENDALSDWLENLATEVEDYESSEPMTTKCIPSKHRSSSCCFDADSMRSMPRMQTDSSLEEYKLEILNKCFNAIWRQESENEILNNLYVFLNDIFSSFFRRHSTHNEPKTTAKEVVRRQRRGRENAYNSDIRKGVDKKAVEKLETFILSVSLNRRVITYDKCLKFYFAFASSQTLFALSGEVRTILNLCRVLFHRNQSKQTAESFRNRKNLLRTLKLIFWNREAVRKAAHFSQVCDANREEIVKEENIYQPIWKWRTDCKSAIRCDNIYAPLELIVERDDNDWEIDSEFCFLDAKSPRRASHENMFRTICILICDENPEFNLIHYSYDSSKSVHDNIEPKKPETTENGYQQLETLVGSDSLLKVDSVEAWKKLMRGAFYCEDEEDLIMSESEIASLKPYQPEVEEKIISFVPSDNSLEGAPKSKLITTSVGSYELKSAASDSSIVETSVHGNYRNIAENDSNTTNTSLESVEIVEEPKKEREKFRDKMKGKFKLKSSRAQVANVETAEVTKEIEEEFFGTNLETVEKDSEQKFVPKIVVDCISVLENESNIKTPGLYRVSGNKTVIEAFKKKSNDKKSLKKDPKYSSLKNQDVHSVTGILKMFFRELSPPLMPSSIFVACTSDNVTLEQIGSTLKQMPVSNYQTLKYLMAHLKRVDKEKDENLMNSVNLAICWGLCIFSSSFDTTNQFFENDISRCNVLCKKMIDHFGTIFM